MGRERARAQAVVVFSNDGRLRDGIHGVDRPMSSRSSDPFDGSWQEWKKLNHSTDRTSANRIRAYMYYGINQQQWMADSALASWPVLHTARSSTYTLA